MCHWEVYYIRRHGLSLFLIDDVYFDILVKVLLARFYHCKISVSLWTCCILCREKLWDYKYPVLFQIVTEFYYSLMILAWFCYTRMVIKWWLLEASLFFPHLLVGIYMLSLPFTYLFAFIWTHGSLFYSISCNPL